MIRFTAEVDWDTDPVWGIWDNEEGDWYSDDRYRDEVTTIGKCQLLNRKKFGNEME